MVPVISTNVVCFADVDYDAPAHLLVVVPEVVHLRSGRQADDRNAYLFGPKLVQ